MTQGLLDMPDDVMSKIMENFRIKTIMNLRKVCHDLRNFVDDVKPDAKLEKIEIVLECDYIAVDYTRGKERRSIIYEKDEEGCLVGSPFRGKKVLLKNEDFFTVGMTDIEIVLRHQKSLLKIFDICGISKTNWNEDLAFKEHFKRIFKTRVHPLKVKRFTTVSMNQSQIMSILPFLDSKTIKKMKISNSDDYLEVDKLIRLDQLKNVDMDLGECWIDLEYIQYFTHFSAGNIYFKTTHFPNLVSLKDIYLQSTGFQCIRIKITKKYNSDDIRRSTELFGEPNLNAHDRMNWFHPIPATNKALKISVLKNDGPVSIILSRIDRQRAIIQN